MGTHRFTTGLGALALGLMVALAPVTVASAGTHHGVATDAGKHKKAKHKPTKTGTQQAATTSAPLCTFLNGESSNSAKLGATIEQAVESGNFAAAKATLLGIFNDAVGEGAKEKAAIAKTPANVQAALNTLIASDSKFQAAVSSATSFQGLEQSLVTLGQTPGLSSAAETVATYADSSCTATSTTPTT